MILNSNKRLRKVISLLLKTVIFVLSIWYVFKKLQNSDLSIYLPEILSKMVSIYLGIALFLVLVNWGIEAIKWQYLIRKMESISFLTAFKSILSGVTISIFTPNRVGEFAGRVFYLKSAEKIKATFISLIGSGFQLFITILAGLFAGFFYYQQHKNDSSVLNFVTKNEMLLYSSIILFILFFALILILKRDLLPKKIAEVLALFNSWELFNIFALSLLRYFVFSFQYYLVLKAFGIDVGLFNSLLLIAITFFVSSAIPSFALTEITVRGATSVYFLSSVSNNTTSIIASSIVLWIINLAIPALIGSLFIWNLKFFKD